MYNWKETGCAPSSQRPFTPVKQHLATSFATKCKDGLLEILLTTIAVFFQWECLHTTRWHHNSWIQAWFTGSLTALKLILRYCSDLAPQYTMGLEPTWEQSSGCSYSFNAGFYWLVALLFFCLVSFHYHAFCLCFLYHIIFLCLCFYT